jgi:hypothetical protein
MEEPMEQDDLLVTRLRVLQGACADNRAAFIEALRRHRDVSELVAEARSLESAVAETVRAVRERQPASA